MKQLNNIIIETERLYLRKMQLSDMQALRDILQDKEVMYAYEHGFSDEEVVQWYERQQERYVQDGVGLLAVILKILKKAAMLLTGQMNVIKENVYFILQIKGHI